jgi:4-aminobutyrate aminotransferase-like enzyme
MDELLHAMGDVHPHPLKARLARELSRLTFERWRALGRESKGAAARPGKTIFCNSGFEAVEAALKTALLATGRPGVVAFQGAYHGLGYGALNATEREHFRGPFRPQLREFARFVPFPEEAADLDLVEGAIRSLARRVRPGAILVEPVQGRGGIRVPPRDFLPRLRRLCDEHGALLIVDEVYTGLGRTGRWFACEHSETVPDLICLGKALTGGFPLSACVGRGDLMDAAWPKSTGEAIHTSTYLGHPVGCAMALAQIAEVRAKGLVARSACLGGFLLRALSGLSLPSRYVLLPRGRGLMAGLEVREAGGAPATRLVMKVIKTMLAQGFILLPEGEHSNVIAFTPPLCITKAQLTRAVRALGKALRLCALA